MKGAGVVSQHAHTAVTRQAHQLLSDLGVFSDTAHGNQYYTVLAMLHGNVKQNNITFFVLSVKNILICIAFYLALDKFSLSMCLAMCTSVCACVVCACDCI